jgi:hypothetical protein
MRVPGDKAEFAGKADEVDPGARIGRQYRCKLRPDKSVVRRRAV